MHASLASAGLDMEGVYRLSPNARIIETFRATFDKSEFNRGTELTMIIANLSVVLFIVGHVHTLPLPPTSR